MQEVGAIALMESKSRIYGFCHLVGASTRAAVGLRGGATEDIGLFYWDYAARRRSMKLPMHRAETQPTLSRAELASQKLRAPVEAAATARSSTSIRNRSDAENATQAQKIRERKAKKKAVQSGREQGKKGRDKARRGGRESKGGGGGF